MTTYSDAGVHIEEGDKASRLAAKHSGATFASRKGMIGQPVETEDGFGGFLDMGDYYLVQSDDSTGSKIDLAFTYGKLDTLGYDLVAMVTDDVVCTGAEPISITNTMDVPLINADYVDAMMKGLSEACSAHKIVIPAGEIAEVPGAVEKGVWSATVTGIVKKDRVIDPSSITEGDVIIAMQSGVARSNGFSLIRKILKDNIGDDWMNAEWQNGQTWGDVILTPSIIYTSAVLSLIGRFDEERTVHVKGVSHITGGGIPSKFRRILRDCGLGANLKDLFPPHDAIKDIIEMGSVQTEEAYRTWNMGNGMMLVVDPTDVEQSLELISQTGIEAKVCGEVTKENLITIHAFDGSEVLV